ncbi:DUF5000 domain-containing lipoprotein [Flavivirga eckloniae]|uniref:F5/8 type C domain-containing protein n=1 Tax=Flavivirga eckloniae TaxID=1803846 RepID=A0A2K9PLL4_9FLAO|nr:DUF5000 domain-containing lipoprotein [Flavivirga eckloniae]AUP77916.1 hypothetical protein C1H87_03990 [Flavivirga eckloniae]
MKNNVYFLIILNLLLLGCDSDVEKSALINASDAAPDQVSNVQIENIIGGAVISYNLPKSESLLYIVAEYELNNDKKVEQKASYFNNEIKLVGFGESKEYDVQLYSVSRGGKKSEPLNVVINPLEPQFKTTYKSLELIPDFGGFKLNFENLSESDLRIFVLATNSEGEVYTPETFYTKRKEGSLAVRGFKDVEQTFGVYVKDRWDNTSDTLYKKITPLFEEKIDKSKFKPLKLPGDTHQHHIDSNYRMEAMWDDVWGVGFSFHTKPITGMPQWFTIDLGTKAKLSRFKLHHQGSPFDHPSGPYKAGSPEKFELYGSNDPNADGSWDSWTLIGDFESRKPSGQAERTQEDWHYAAIEGEDFDFDSPEAYRYIRFKTTKTWGGVTYIYICELTFFGQVIE